MPISDPMEPKELVEIRERLGLTQIELAVRLGRSSTNISHMETGRTPISTSFAILMRMIDKNGFEKEEEK